VGDEVCCRGSEQRAADAGLERVAERGTEQLKDGQSQPGSDAAIKNELMDSRHIPRVMAALKDACLFQDWRRL